MQLSKYITKYIEAKKVRKVFMLSGTGSIYLDDAFSKSKKLNYICARHEAAAVMMANATSKLNGTVGVVVATTGPGGTNAIGGLTESWVDSVPILVISGQTFSHQISNKARSFGLQGFNIIDNVKKITKYSAIINDPKKIKYHLDKAFYYATEGRPGPVWLDIPMNIQAAEVNPGLLKGFKKKDKIKKIDSLKYKKFNKILNHSKNPVILFGQGIRLSNSINIFKKFLKNLNIPAICTRMGLDILKYDDPNFFGLAGIRGHRFAQRILKKADLILTIGTSVPHTVLGKDLNNINKKVQIISNDIDLNELKKKNLNQSKILFNLDCKDFLEKLRKSIKKSKNHQWSKWFSYCKEVKNNLPTLDKRVIKNPINSYYLIECLNSLSKSNAIFINDAGSANYVSSQGLKIKGNQREITSGAFYSMGVAVPMSVGAAAAYDNRRQAIVVTGDGSIELNIQELRTISLGNFNIKIFVINNGGYASIRKSQDDIMSGGHYIDDTSVLNFENIAKAFKIKYLKIDNYKNLKSKIKSVLNKKGPYLIEVICDDKQKIIETV